MGHCGCVLHGQEQTEEPAPPPVPKVKKANFRGNRMGTNAEEKEFKSIPNYRFEDEEREAR